MTEVTTNSKAKSIKEAILKVSDGLIGSFTNFLLFQLYLSGELFGAMSNRDIYNAFEKANDSLEDLNYQKFKRAIAYLLKNDLVKKSFIGERKRLGKIELKITQEGRKRLEEIIPSYKKIRTWDRRVYLITYDVPNKEKRKRDLLREYLKRIGCGFLQESVWLSPYNPKGIIRDFVKDNNLGGLILVSSLGKDGSVGEEDIKSLIKKVYNLELLNKRYREFIHRFEASKKVNRSELSFGYYQILKNDPQLPFELLTKDWFGEKAYRLFILKR